MYGEIGVHWVKDTLGRSSLKRNFSPLLLFHSIFSLQTPQHTSNKILYFVEEHAYVCNEWAIVFNVKKNKV